MHIIWQLETQLATAHTAIALERFRRALQTSSENVANGEVNI